MILWLRVMRYRLGLWWSERRERLDAAVIREEWLDALAAEALTPARDRYHAGRYEGNDSPLMAEWLDENTDHVLAEGGDTETTGYLAVYEQAPWQSEWDPKRYGLWTDSLGFRVVQVFETWGEALATLAELDRITSTPTCDVCGREQEDSPNILPGMRAFEADWNAETGNHALCEVITDHETAALSTIGGEQ